MQRSKTQNDTFVIDRIQAPGGASVDPVNLHSLKLELLPLTQPEMTDEFICHASNPRQSL